MYTEYNKIETQLEKISQSDSQYKDLFATWNLNKKILSPILNAIIKDYPHYSLHDHSHSESILLNIERMLGNENIEKLSPTDLWLLLHVSYLHDFGMVIVDSKIHEIWNNEPEFNLFLTQQLDSSDPDVRKAASIIRDSGKNSENYNPEWALEIKNAVTILVSTFFRWQHSDYSRYYILDIDKIWGIDLGHNGLIKKRLLSLMGDISAIHTKPFSEVMTLHKEANGLKNDYVHPRLIACLLRIGDVLDLDNGRFNRYGDKIFGKMPDSSKIHYYKHESTKHILITDKLIEVEADCPNDQTYRETRKWYDSLQSEINNLQLNWIDIAPDGFSFPPKLAPYKILRQGKEDSNELTNLKFYISQSKAFEILEGSAIYKDKFSCIREIVQNAEDATKIQLWRDIKSGMYYSAGIDKSKVKSGNLLPNDIPAWIYKLYDIDINVEKNNNNNAVVTVSDHGTGITFDSLKAICNVGQSYYQKKEIVNEITEMPVWLRPTANFGIGLQSCFLLTDKIVIYTNTSKYDTIKITFESGKQDGYVNVETSNTEYKRGSKVEIEIKNSMNFSFNMFGYTAKYLMEIEPFETNCVQMYKAIESIFNECGSSFFNINVTSESAKYTNTIKAYINSEKNGFIFPQKLHNDDIRYQLSYDLKTMNAWYKNNMYKIKLDQNSNGLLKIHYKGKYVPTNKIRRSRFVGFVIDVDIYGISTKEALSLNREELSYETSNLIYKDLEKLIKTYFELVLNESQNLKEDTDLLNSIFLSSWLYDVKITKELSMFVSNEPNIRILYYETDKYIVKNCSLRDMSEQFPYIYYLDCDVQKQQSVSSDYMTEDMVIKMLNDARINNQKIILIDENVKRFLSVPSKDYIYLDCEKTLCLQKPSIKDDLYDLDDFTKNILLRRLVHEDDEKIYHNVFYTNRKAIPAFNEFSKLAVSLNNITFVGKEGDSKWNIISPISKNDYKKIKDLSLESFIDFIFDQNTFENLVQYTLENAKQKTNKETIKSEYKRLIEQYYYLVNPE